MTNKEKLKKAMEQDLNPQNYYHEIIEKLEKGEQMKKKKKWKWALVPICLVMIICGGLFLNDQKENKNSLENKSYIDKENNITLNINDLTNDTVGMPKLDADIKTITGNDINFPLPYLSVDIPNDLNRNDKYIVYTKNTKDSDEYNILNNYEIEYSKGKDRTIKVAYSKEYQPIRDYYFSKEGSKATTINGVEFIIYQYEDSFFTEFTYNGYNFDIETSKITEQELSTFLLSILK